MGGTITFASGKEGAVPALTAATLADHLGVHLDTVDVTTGSSIAISGVDLCAVAGELERTRAQGYRGAIVTHGTDTLEETAYFLALTMERGFPVALTGAMRHQGETGSDGARNVLDALAFLGHPEASAVGPVVVMDGTIHSARFVAKVDTASVASFQSPATGPIGAVAEHRPSLWYRPAYEDFVGPPTDRLPRVEVLAVVTAADSIALEAILGTAPDGLVLAGYGGGHVPPTMLARLEQAASDGTPIVVASRCSGSDTLRGTYAVPGTEIDLRRRGMLMAGRLSALKTRLRLSVGLANEVPASQLFPVD